MKMLFCATIFALAIPIAAEAAFLMQVNGETTVATDAAPVRAEYPDGQILGVLHKDEAVDVDGAAGDGRGTWVRVKSKADKKLEGYVDADQTTFWLDMKSGRLKQPSR